MNKITFGTLNINGGGENHNHQAQVKSLMRRKNIDILLLQETHITHNVEDDWCLVGGQCVFINLFSISAGVAFILTPGLTPESCLFREIVKGRFISFYFSTNLNKFHFIRSVS